VEDKIGSVHKVVDCVVSHREAVDPDSRLVIDREAAEEVASIADAADHTRPAQATDIQRFVAAGECPVAMQ
jgi:hypothetical protein